MLDVIITNEEGMITKLLYPMPTLKKVAISCLRFDFNIKKFICLEFSA